MRRPRACLAHTSSGRLGSPSGPTTWLCRSRLDAGRMKAAKAVRIRDDQLSHPHPEARSPRPKSPQWSAARRCASGTSSPRPRCRKRNNDKGAPFGAPCPSCWGRNQGINSRDARERWRASFVGANGASPKRACCLKIESEFEVTGDARLKFDVVPAKAGTHNHRTWW